MISFVAETIVGAVRAHAAASPHSQAVGFASGSQLEAEWRTYGELWQRACTIAGALRAETPRGERAILLYPPGLDFVDAFLACQCAGVIAVPLYPPHPRRPDDLERLRRIVAQTGATLVLTTELYRAVLAQMMAGVAWDAEVRTLATNVLEPRELEHDASFTEPAGVDTAFLQYSSGSTGFPKGVVVRHENLLRNEQLICGAFEHDSSLVGGGWLPLYHDMGLIGLLLQPLYLGARTTLMSPLEFMQHPDRWLRLVSKYRIQTTGAPTFAFDLCATRCTEAQLEGIDLSCWDLAFCGAEPVRPAALQRFADRFARYGFKSSAFYACYGLAEATLFVTGGRKQTGLKMVAVDAQRLSDGEVALMPESASEPAATVMSVGWAHDGQLAIVDPHSRQRVGVGRIGEIWVQATSVTTGYWRDPEATERTFRAYTLDGDGPFLRTGDLGFVLDGELFVTGRAKDVVIIRGRNVFAEDVEETVSTVLKQVAATTVVAFGLSSADEEHLVVVAEARTDALRDGYAANATQLREAVVRRFGVPLDAIVLTKRGGIPRTTSGKVQRSECRRLLQLGLEGQTTIWCASALRGSLEVAGPTAGNESRS